ncbi:hypothetical protein NPX99_07715 [Bartonella sp. 220]|nr:hypothetical protein [Bartonella sp. 220B]
MWYDYKISLNGHEDITIGQGGVAVAKRFENGNPGGTTVIGKNFITATGGHGGGGAYSFRNSIGLSGSITYYYSGSGGVGGEGRNFGLATNNRPGIAKGGNGYAGTGGTRAAQVEMEEMLEVIHQGVALEG